jgi:hypothetical protein
MKKLILFLLYVFSARTQAIDFFQEYYCTPPAIKNGACQKGDLLVATSTAMAMMYCDFEEKVVSFSVKGQFICYFSGAERKRRPTELIPSKRNPFDQFDE